MDEVEKTVSIIIKGAESQAGILRAAERALEEDKEMGTTNGEARVRYHIDRLKQTVSGLMELLDEKKKQLN